MRDQKLARKFGGPSVAENIVRRCRMCNGGTSISAMSRQFNRWLHEL
jgi:hypothetical protein